MPLIHFTPGPSQLYPTVPGHLARALEEQIPSISHRSARFQAIFEDARNGIRQVLGVPGGHEIFFTTSATEVWERILQNTLPQRSYHYVNGAFSARFFEFAQGMVPQAEHHTVPIGEAFGFEESVDRPEAVELVGLCANESSGGTTLLPHELAAVRAKFPEAILCLDLVSIAPMRALKLKMVDCAYFSVQKCFGLPAGLGVMILSPAAMERSESCRAAGQHTGTFRSFDQLKKYGDKSQTPETPNVLGIYLLGQVCQDFLDVGVDRLREMGRQKADEIYTRLGESPRFQPLVTDEDHRSPTVAVFHAEEGSAAVIARAKEAGFVIGSGYGSQKATHIRIANFPAHQPAHVRALLDCILA